jgi:hypothetical protein
VDKTEKPYRIVLLTREKRDHNALSVAIRAGSAIEGKLLLSHLKNNSSPVHSSDSGTEFRTQFVCNYSHTTQRCFELLFIRQHHFRD